MENKEDIIKLRKTIQSLIELCDVFIPYEDLQNNKVSSKLDAAKKILTEPSLHTTSV